ncbi:MAG TPA: gephyrin-like molybdotransferase Glp [Terriglobia bacterium]|nr:gephyrin-like molybdotransferase Glp [Terriglobia bacterium]
MIPIERAVEIVTATAAERRAGRMPPESVELAEARGRVLREAVVSAEDSPPFDKSIRDGFALRAGDVLEPPVHLRVVGESRAGKAFEGSVGRGECCEIMTGAPLPAGADSVVMVEYTERPESGVARVLRSVAEGGGTLRRGAETRAGDLLIPAGRKISLADIGLLASAGRKTPMVSRKPRVAIVATGDELVDPTATPGSGQIRNSNSYTLAAQVIAAGAEPVLLGIARDDLPDLREKIGRALEHDIALVSGGVSMGKYDFVEPVLDELGVTTLFDKVAMKPGKPTVFGYREGTFVFGLPGNPVSTIVSFHMFVRPVISSLLWEESRTDMLEGVLEAPTKCDPERVAIVPAHARFADGAFRVRTASWKGSSDLAGLARSNALVVIPSREGTLAVGENVQFLSLE